MIIGNNTLINFSLSRAMQESAPRRAQLRANAEQNPERVAAFNAHISAMGYTPNPPDDDFCFRATSDRGYLRQLSQAQINAHRMLTDTENFNTLA
ncbi:MAG: hypothetical protein FWB96_00035 [Defluviitaleaceae bacterium]|nr:hypothetical protein [Defluviitaleaceae bacterium]MCL2262568.1 hypothetical protein [Defluviitaleaceae bacterium]